ncbi:type VI secretion system baseplate subunit TssG [Pseudomonas sp. 148P]|uniref:Type VI secretion system baseplate subunit TssG n=1 Tax=Pseudomonas ulcerans TaxID=3115852 RepID=A0ABU7HUU8_9PSED|nr:MULTISPECIES: type VI secretion system baseplate subunit TssG [unclassified Pseudomonas]MEE1924014.1 type VI secretion system baseplate subunit TssG [Pseudomonas sp. 147P]MEE1935223.1 type VI secretion system baseplate subunit TssG [Pseudomonas sp. 148P]
MDTPHGAAAPALTRLSQGIREYSLFQGMQRVLTQLAQANPGLSQEQVFEQLEFQANPSMGFPVSEIDRVHFFEEHGMLRARLRINLLGLFGAASPLPLFYAEQAVADSDGGHCTRDFLDVFNNRLQRLLLQIWQKYRYHASFRRDATDAFSEQLFALIGLGGAQIRRTAELDWKRLLPYLGLLSLRAHSGALIESVLRYYFKHEALFIEQCMARRIAIPSDQQNALGQTNHQLCETAVLGEYTVDGGSQFRVHIQQLGWDQLHTFLPIGDDYRPLCALVRFTLRDPLSYDIQLRLRPEEIREQRIGEDNQCHLGWTSWLGHEHADGIVTLNSAVEDCTP